jgi:hypothetical protein
MSTRPRTHRAKQLEQRLAAGPKWTEHDLIFPNRAGEPRREDTVNKIFKKLLKEAGLPDHASTTYDTAVPPATTPCPSS